MSVLHGRLDEEEMYREIEEALELAELIGLLED